jgi:hypothetical protein
MDKAQSVSRVLTGGSFNRVAPAPSSLQKIRLSSDIANPLGRSRNWRADGDGCVGLARATGQRCDGLHGWNEPRRGSSSDRILIAEKPVRCAFRFNRVTDSKTRIGAAVWAPNVPPFHPAGYMDKAPHLALEMGYPIAFHCFTERQLIKLRPVGARFEHHGHNRELVPNNLRASAPGPERRSTPAGSSISRVAGTRLRSGFAAGFPRYRTQSGW